MRFRSLRSRLLAAGFCLVAVPVAVMNGIWVYKSLSAEESTYRTSAELVSGDLRHVADLTSEMADSYNKQLGRETEILLKVAQSVGRRLGAPNTSGPAIEWVAKNQFTQLETKVALPPFRYGLIALSSDRDPKVRAPFVDDVRELTTATCTVFQRMNEVGDMLRVSTSVIANDGKRGTGTFVPAVNPEGKPNPVVARVMKGETFVGRAFVVDSWYMSAYTPIRSLDGGIIGMLYVGIPQKTATEDLKTTLHKLSFGASGRVLVFNALGKTAGQAFWPEDREAVEALAAVPDGDRKLLDEICRRAVTLKRGEEASFPYKYTHGGSLWKRVVRVRYYPVWDWVIAVDAAEDEIYAAPQRMRADNKSTRNLALLVAIGGLAAASIAWWFIAAHFSKDLGRVSFAIRRAAEGFQLRLNN